MNTIQASSWHATLTSVSHAKRHWLQDHGSLTHRIQERCDNFRVEPTFQSLSRVYEDEPNIMNLRRDELAMVREVHLYCSKQPVVFAHSVVNRESLRGAWRGLSGLGNQSLGTVLFTNPKVKRTALEFKKLKKDHFIFDRASQRLGHTPSSLWARRSLFTLQGQSILVTEVFLPAILDLTS